MSAIQFSGYLRSSMCRKGPLFQAMAQAGSRRWLSETSKAATSSAGDIAEIPTKKRVKRSRAQIEADLLTDLPLKRGEAKLLAMTGDTARAVTVPRRRGRPKVETKWDEKDFTFQLPPPAIWPSVFRHVRDTAGRASIRNPETAQKLAEALVPEGSKDNIIIDANPGPGQLTRALLALPKERIKKIIVLESAESYLKFLKPLESLDPRVSVLPWSSKDWDSYRKLEEMGMLADVPVVAGDQPHPTLHFVMHITGKVDGEQLINQIFRAMPDGQWLFKYGRVPVHFILPLRISERVKARENTTARGKVAVMAQAAAELKEWIKLEDLQPYGDHFHPQTPYIARSETSTKHPELRRKAGMYTSLSCVPKERPIIHPNDLYLWDYCLRKLFVQKATPLRKCISSLGPGAYNLLPKLGDPSLSPESIIDPDSSPRELTNAQWAQLVSVFKDWPFRPEDLSIDTFFLLGGDPRSG